MSSFIKVTLDRIEKGVAIFLSEDHKEFFWPQDKIPKGAKIGSSFYLTLEEKPTVEEEKRKIAKLMLEEILKTGEEENLK